MRQQRDNCSYCSFSVNRLFIIAPHPTWGNVIKSNVLGIFCGFFRIAAGFPTNRQSIARMPRHTFPNGAEEVVPRKKRGTR